MRTSTFSGPLARWLATAPVQALVIGVLAFGAAQGLQALKLLEAWEYATWGWRVRFFAAPAPSSEQIKLILLDQASLDWGARENGLAWPWPREVYAPIIEFCRRGGAKLVAFDVLYTESSVYGVEDDQRLAQAVASFPVILPLFLGQQTQQQRRWPQSLPRPGLVPQPPEGPPPATSAAVNATFPIPELARAARSLAHVAEIPDPDGIFRRASLFRLFDGEVVPSLGLAALLLGRPDTPLALEPGGLRVGTQRLALNPEHEVILRFRGESGVYHSVSAAAVLQSELRLQAGESALIDPALFKDRYVLFGFSAPGLKDLRPTPVSGDYPGVEVHATLLDNLLQGDSLRPAPAWAAALASLLLACLAALWVLLCRRAAQVALGFLLFPPLPVAAGFLAYPAGYWWPVLAGGVATVLALVSAVILSYATEGRQKRFIKSAFRHYLSPAVIDQILLEPSRLKLGGERRELSIMFSDVQGFTGISENMSPEQLIALLNDYLSDMTDIILDQGGTLDKYEGDAILAFWGAPLSQPDHALRTCRAALYCQRRLEQRREEFYRRTGSRLYARIGIHSGEVVVGNMGSKRRFDYTILGDAANLASRLEGANKAFGTFTMVSETTWAQTGGAFSGREIGTLRVVGRNAPVTVYELLGLNGDPPPPHVAVFAQGLEYCRQRQWRQAAGVFESIPHDPVALVYLERCRQLLRSGEDWDGVWVLSEK